MNGYRWDIGPTGSEVNTRRSTCRSLPDAQPADNRHHRLNAHRCVRFPGTGKTTLAAAIARRLGAVHISVDAVEEGLLRAGLEPGWTTGVGAYEAVRAAAEQNLRLGHTVVVDAVNDSDAARDTWRQAVANARRGLRFVMLHPPEVDEHRRRLHHRQRPFSRVAEPTWEQVCERARMYAPWSDEPIELSANESVDALVEHVHAALQANP